MDEEAVRQAKGLAKRKGTSVSALFEQWTRSQAKLEHAPPLHERMTGLWSPSTSTGSEDLDEVRLRSLLEKHAK